MSTMTMPTNEIVKDSNNITLENSAVHQKKFCTIWPQCKQGLEMLRDIIKNPIAKGAVNIVISAGDAVSGKVCH